MAGSSIGEVFRITSFGESHGAGIGVVIDGCPAGVQIDTAMIQAELDRRRPGQSAITTQRREADAIEILSGIYDGMTLGSPIAILIRNSDANPADYDRLRDTYRPSHADYTYQAKYGHRDHRGGGRASARETAARVAAGAIAKSLLAYYGISVQAYVSSIGTLTLDTPYTALELSQVEQSIVRCPDPRVSEQMIALIHELKVKGDSLGGIITAVVRGCPVGLGEPVYDKLHADLGKAMLSINAVKGFEYGSGFAGSSRTGSQENDVFATDESGKVTTLTNHSGGIQGGISNGMDIYMRIAFKPTATISSPQQSINTAGEAVTIEPGGRHDPCVLPRAVPIVEAMAALVIADHLLRARLGRLDTSV